MADPGELTFRVTARQRRKVIRGSILTVVIVLGILASVPIAVKGRRFDAAYWKLMGGILALFAAILLPANIMTAIAYTKCTPAGISTRCGWMRRTCTWDQVSAIGVVRRVNSYQSTVDYTVEVTTVQGELVTLGAPNSSNLNQDLEFENKYNQIVAYHQRMIGAPG